MANKKEKDPALLFYSKDWLVGTFFMSYEQKGKYIDLLCMQHQKGHLTEEEMGKILTDVDGEVIDKFIQDENGKWYNVKLEQEMNRRAKYSEYQSELAKRRWEKDAKASTKASTKKKPTDVPNQCMRTETETVTGRSKSTSTLSKSPKTMFHIEDSAPNLNSLDDLYETL